MLQQRVARVTQRVVAVARLFKWAGAAMALVLVLGVPMASASGQPTVGLGTAGSFAVLAGQGVTNTGATVINGDLGTSPNPAVTGFPPGKVTGAIHKADAVALQAQKDLTTAYNDAAGRTPVTTIATQLGGQTLKPGVYNSASGTFQITGTLTLDAQGDPNGVFIFQTASTLVTASTSRVSLVGSAGACNVFWKVGSSATLGTNSNFTGNILALTSSQVQTGVTVDGRVLARNASVTLDDDTITSAACSGTVPSGGVPTGGGSTAGVQDQALLAAGFALLVAAGAAFAVRRRVIRKGSPS
jgi:hypothetical protein